VLRELCIGGSKLLVLSSWLPGRGWSRPQRETTCGATANLRCGSRDGEEENVTDSNHGQGQKKNN
jgi:hypothetical protein